MRFCQKEYCTSGGFSGEGYSKLSKNIQQYSRKQDGCSYVKNGTTAYKGTKQGRWRCCFNQVYSDQSGKVGKAGVKKRVSRTKLTKDTEFKCPLRFAISLNPNDGYFYMHSHRNNKFTHSFHSKENIEDVKASPKFISPELLKEYNEFRLAGIPPAYIRLIAQLKSDVPVTTSLIEYITGGSKLFFNDNCKVQFELFIIYILKLQA